MKSFCERGYRNLLLVFLASCLVEKKSFGASNAAVRLVLLCLALGVSACPAQKEAPQKPPLKKSPTVKGKASKNKRPPHPNMAGAAWGLTVLEGLAEQANPALTEKGHKVAFEMALAQLHKVNLGAEKVMKDAAVAAWRTAMSDAERGVSAALVAVSLVLDPDLKDYAARLTDAHGIGAYAGQLPESSVMGQVSRGLVGIATGRVVTGQKLITHITGASNQADLDANIHLLTAQALYILGDRSDEFFSQLEMTLKEQPDSARARLLQARGLLSGYIVTPILAWEKKKQLSSREKALLARALLLNGETEKGLKQLESLKEQVPEGQRGELLFWRGMALLNDLARGDDVLAIVEQLKVQRGYRGEALLLEANVAMGKGDYKTARKNTEILTKRPGVTQEVGIAAAWLLVDACAALGDEKCVKNSGQNAVVIDGNRARLAHAWAALGLVGGQKTYQNGKPLEPIFHQKQGHLLSPFNAKLAKAVNLPVAKGGEEAAALLRGARALIALGALQEAQKILKSKFLQSSSCGACQALAAVAEPHLKRSNALALKAVNNVKAPLANADTLALIDIFQRSGLIDAREALEKIAKTHASLQVRSAARDALAGKEAESIKRPGEVKIPGARHDAHPHP